MVFSFNGSVGVVVYHIRWQWISLPLVVFLGSGIFPTVVILHTKSHQLHPWKSSSLAVLKCGGQLPNLFREDVEIMAMNDKTNKMSVSFEK
jgi:hypothetical protein